MWNTSSTTTEDVLFNNMEDDSNRRGTTHNGPDDKILLMMLKMGYKSGLGLGKNKQGIVKPLDIEIKADHYGLGMKNAQLNLKWDYEEVSIKEIVEWFDCDSNLDVTVEVMECWLRIGNKKLTVNDETNFCDADVLMKILNAKGMLNQFNEIDLLKGRSKSNPFESIKSAFFMNRAALKMANIDACTDFIFTNIDRNPDHQKKDGPYYFADVCAGPGGFSEYILWRKGWGFKGFGLTLRMDNDFKLIESNCASSATFHPLYGLTEDGDICRPENIEDFARKVLHETQGEGVHFMMSDGGFSVEGNENLQEVLSKQLYLCQCLVALEIVRKDGHFVSKFFDIFTPFSVGLIFLMQSCFCKFAIIKPNTSRPANSERYIVFYGLKKTKQTIELRKYLRKVVAEFWSLRSSDDNLDVTDIVPLQIIKEDVNFTKYITDMNNTLGAKQIKNLWKLITFCKNSNLIDPRQEILRSKCLMLWRIPDKLRIVSSYITIDDLLDTVVNAPEFMLVQARQANTMKDLKKYVTDVSDWHFVPMNCDKLWNICNFYAAISGCRVYRLQNHKWIKVKNLKLSSGTILYGEIVKEYMVEENFDTVEMKCLHVIDAMRLGDVSLVDLSFNERLSLIATYCKAVNFDFNNTIGIRPKYVKPFDHLTFNCPINFNVNDNKYFMQLSNPYKETLDHTIIVNSIMLLKVDENQSFKSTYVLRVQINMDNEDQNISNDQDKFINLNDLLYYLNKE